VERERRNAALVIEISRDANARGKGKKVKRGEKRQKEGIKGESRGLSWRKEYLDREKRIWGRAGRAFVKWKFSEDLIGIEGKS